MISRPVSTENRRWTVEYLDEFADGLGVGRGWQQLSVGPHTADDGVATSTASAVRDVDADIRLGAATVNVMDFETGLVFDFWIGQSVVVPFYERLQVPGAPTGYEAFTSVAEPMPRVPGAVHDLAIVIDAVAATAAWEVDGVAVASVARLGRSDPVWTKVIDHGGEPLDAVPARVVVGLGLLTLLDSALPPSLEGLADLGSPVVFPPRFATERPTLFGQGVRLDVERVAVERAAVDR